jgi:hypothetical protein
VSEVWDRVYQSGNTFFAKEPSGFATLCYRHMKPNNAKNAFERWAGQGIDIMFDSFYSKKN